MAYGNYGNTSQHTVFYVNNQGQVENRGYTTVKGHKQRYNYEAKIPELADLKQQHAQATGEDLVEISSANRMYQGQPTDNHRWGQECSAMNLTWYTHKNDAQGRPINYPVENVFQASKNFDREGSHPDWLKISPFQAQQNAKQLTRQGQKFHDFNLYGHKFDGDPHNFFYNYIYCRTLGQKENKPLQDQVFNNRSFSDIYFHKGQENCQAQACAIASGLNQRGLFKHAISSPDNFKHDVYESGLLKTAAAQQTTTYSQDQGSTTYSKTHQHKSTNPFAKVQNRLSQQNDAGNHPYTKNQQSQGFKLPGTDQNQRAKNPFAKVQNRPSQQNDASNHPYTKNQQSQGFKLPGTDQNQRAKNPFAKPQATPQSSSQGFKLPGTDASQRSNNPFAKPQSTSNQQPVTLLTLKPKFTSEELNDQAKVVDKFTQKRNDQMNVIPLDLKPGQPFIKTTINQLPDPQPMQTNVNRPYIKPGTNELDPNSNLIVGQSPANRPDHQFAGQKVMIQDPTDKQTHQVLVWHNRVVDDHDPLKNGYDNAISNEQDMSNEIEQVTSLKKGLMVAAMDQPNGDQLLKAVKQAFQNNSQPESNWQRGSFDNSGNKPTPSKASKQASQDDAIEF